MIYLLNSVSRNCNCKRANRTGRIPVPVQALKISNSQLYQAVFLFFFFFFFSFGALTSARVHGARVMTDAQSKKVNCQEYKIYNSSLVWAETLVGRRPRSSQGYYQLYRNSVSQKKKKVAVSRLPQTLFCNWLLHLCTINLKTESWCVYHDVEAQQHIFLFLSRKPQASRRLFL